MSESNLWDRMRKGLLAIEDQLSTPLCIERIENAVGVGTADVNGVAEMYEFWLELKHIDNKPKRDGPVFGRKGLRKEQEHWLYRRAQAGGRVFIFAQIEKGLVLVHGCFAYKFNNWDIEEIGAHARWKHYGPNPDWLSLMRAIQFGGTQYGLLGKDEGH